MKWAGSSIWQLAANSETSGKLLVIKPFQYKMSLDADIFAEFDNI